MRPPVYRWQVKIATRAWQAVGPVATVTLDPPAGPPESRRPLALLASPTLTYSAADVRVRQHVWPADPIPTSIAGCDALCERLFRPSSIFTPTAAYLEPLFAPEQPFPELARLLVGLALVAQDADARTLAVDLAVELMADGRCRGDELGRVYAARLRQPGILKLGRVAAAVEQIAPHGPLHQHACRRWLEELLPATGAAGASQRDLHHLLAPYLELLISLGESCDPRLQPLLAGLGGTGKTARLARQIREQPGDPARAAARRRLAGVDLLRIRLERARTWRDRLAVSPSPGRV